MKIIKILITAALAMLALETQSQVVSLKSFGVGGTAVNTNLMYAVVPPGEGRPVVTFISASSDQAAAQTGAGTAVTGGVLKLYSINEAQPVTLASAVATNQVQVTIGTNFVSNTVCIYYSMTGTNANTYQRLVANTNTSVTNVTFSSNTTGATGPGDILYRCALVSTIPIGSGTINLGNGTGPIWSLPVAAGTTPPVSWPMLIESSGIGTNVINIHVSGNYVRPSQ
jgi:hypothetical protein